MSSERIELDGRPVDEHHLTDTYRWEWDHPTLPGVRLALVHVPARGYWYRTTRVDDGGWTPDQPVQLSAPYTTDVEVLRAVAELVVADLAGHT